MNEVSIMPKKTELKKGTGCRINEGYVPSDYRHVQNVLDEKAAEMLERLYGKDWQEIINGKQLPEPDKSSI
jgi:hypothetical protein